MHFNASHKQELYHSLMAPFKIFQKKVKENKEQIGHHQGVGRKTIGLVSP